jgi:hypothetical protein
MPLMVAEIKGRIEPMTKDISNSDDRIHSRDVIQRIKELESFFEEDLDEEEKTELKVLKELDEEASQYSSDWSHGEQLIRESHFVEYAQELAEELGMLDKNLSWPYTCIDWEKAAHELRYDYTKVDFDGVEYLIRSN